MLEILNREAIYLIYFAEIQLRQIFWPLVIGILLGSFISVFFKGKIHAFAEKIGRKIPGFFGLIIASLLGIASPLCMYGTIPICASFAQKGLRDDFLAAFMMSSVLLNPQLIIYSSALGVKVLWLRLLSVFLCGITAGILVRIFYKKKHFFDFSNYTGKVRNRDTDKNIFICFFKNVGRNLRATLPWFLLGIILSAVFQRYVSEEFIASLFGKNNGFGILMAATIGVPLYVCGGGTIPLLLDFLHRGMTLGAATAFMISGPATKITNLGALKSALGIKHFGIYILFVMLFAIISGILVNLFL